MSSQQYLADSSAGAASVASFIDVLTGLPAPATAAALRGSADALSEARDRTRLLAERLAAQRLADVRLEQQREQASEALDAVVVAMDDVVAAARAGDPEAAEAASRAFNAAVGDLRSLPASR